MDISKKTIISVIAVVWIVFSLFYIAYDVWSDFKNVQLTQAYQKGLADGQTGIVDQLIKVAQQQCQPFPVTSADKQIQLIDYSCVNSQTPAAE